VVTDFVFEAGFAFVLEAGAFIAFAAAAFTAGFLASAFLLETFFGFAVVAFLDAVAFLEETLGVAAFLVTGLEATFPPAFFDGAFLGLSVTSLGVAFEPSVDDFFTALVVGFLGFSLVEDGFLVVELVFLAEGGFLFSFVVPDGPLYSLTFPDLPLGRVNSSPSPLAMARLKCAMFAAVGSRP